MRFPYVSTALAALLAAAPAPAAAQEPAAPAPADTVRLEEVVVSTRTGRRIEEEPVRVEVIGREEVEEKLLMTPGDISMLLNETSGLRVQPTASPLGGAGVRIQGLRGRYTLILADGLPLHGGQAGGLGTLQVPPMDLGRVEVIKGIASALYGGPALGGVVNLISRAPDGERELLLNATTRGGSDAVLWSSGGLGGGWAYTFLGGAHRQGRHDVDSDGWADLPGYRRGVARPRVFWSDGEGRSLYATVGGTYEDRDGGTLPGRTTPQGSTHRESLGTRRLDAGVVGRALLGGGRLLTVRGSATGERHAHDFGGVLERDRHATAFGEAALAGTARGHTWVAGAALRHEGFRSRDLARFDFGHTTVSAFAQDEVSPAPWVTLSVSARLDAEGEHGTFASPRAALLLRPGAWTARLSAGLGHRVPTPFTEETDALGLHVLQPLGELAAERAWGGSLDVGRAVGPVELNATLFASRIEHALLVRRDHGDEGGLRLANAERPTRTSGVDLLARMEREPFHLVATYTYTRATEEDPESGARREVPLTPRHAAGTVGMWEAEEAGRIGVEVYFTGAQTLAENPYRDRSRPYWIVGFLAERKVGRARVFLNAENVLDARQTRHDPLLLPERSPVGRWTTDAWAPLDGRTFNAGVRLAF